jgi:hypothetical protein
MTTQRKYLLSRTVATGFGVSAWINSHGNRGPFFAARQGGIGSI